jgi:DNA-binding MarR family transcriptional regulator
MVQLSDSTMPSTEACSALLRAMPAIGAIKRILLQSAPESMRAQLAPLGAIVRSEEGLRLSEVAERIYLDISVASRHVSHLIDRGFVTREPDPSDKRASLLLATADGRQWLDRVRARYSEHMRSHLIGWSDDDVAKLTELLEKFSDDMVAASDSFKVDFDEI